jgi:peptidoglycan/xylan/chitin deacetylase (PgdA/CDA1 family)
MVTSLDTLNSALHAFARVLDMGTLLPCMAARNSNSVRSFVFHSVMLGVPNATTSNTPVHSLTVLEDFLDWLRTRAVTISPWQAIPGQVPASEKRPQVLLTFDDATEDNYSLVLPALVQRGLTATFFVPTSTIDAPRHLTRRMIRNLYDAGMGIGSHTVNHPRLTREPLTSVRQELQTSKNDIEQLIGAQCYCLAYPYGDHNPCVQSIAREVGYACAFTAAPVGRQENAWALSRSSMPENASALDFAIRVYGAYQLRKRAQNALLHSRGFST